eukprot:896382_1
MTTGHIMLCIMFTFAILSNVCKSVDSPDDDGVTTINLHDGYMFVYQAQERKNSSWNQASRPTHNPTNTPTVHTTSHPTATPHPTPNPTIKPTNLPTYSPTSKPSCNPTRHPTKHPTAKPTKRPTKLPTLKPTQNPTHHPTKHPTDKPTKRPTKLPTLKPTQNPTVPPTDARNKSESARSAKSIDNASKPLALRNTANARAKKPQTKLQNTIKLYDYTCIPGATIQEMQKVHMLYHQRLAADDENKLVIIQDNEHYPHDRVTPFVTDLDVALDKLDQLLYLVVGLSDGNIASNDEMLFENLLYAFVIELRPLRATHQNIIDEFKIFYSVRNQTEVGDMFLDFIADTQLLGSWPIRSLSYKNIALRFVLIAYQELISLKFEETNHLLTNTSYAMAGKIPRIFKTEFEILRKRYEEISQMKYVIDEDMIRAFGTLGEDCMDISKYSLDLQCARVIHDMKGKQKHFGTIVVSSTSVSQRTCIDELLKVLGYSEDSILRLKVVTTRKRHSGYTFKVTPFKVEPTSKFSDDTIAKKRRRPRPRKAIGNKTNSSSSIMKHHYGTIKFIPVYYAETGEVTTINIDHTPPVYDTILRDDQYDVVIIQDLLFHSIDLYQNISDRYAVHDLMDRIVDDIFCWIVCFMERIPQQTSKGLDALITHYIHQFGMIVLYLTPLDRSHLDSVISKMELCGRPMSKLIVITKLLYEELKSEPFDQNNVIQVVTKYIKNEHVNAEGGKLIQDMNFFVEFAFMHVVSVGMENMMRIPYYSRLDGMNQDEKVPDSLKVEREVQEMIRYLSSGVWSNAMNMHIAQHMSVQMRTQTRRSGRRVDMLAEIKNIKTKMEYFCRDFKWLKMLCRIGDVIHNFQRRQDHGAIALVVGTESIPPHMYHLLDTFGYSNETILIENPLSLN